MTAHLIDGRAEAERLLAQVKSRIQAFTAWYARRPCLAVILVGDDIASAVYVRAKMRCAVEAGIASIPYYLPENTSEDDLLRLLDDLNDSSIVDGILVQLPLPPHITKDRVLHHIHPEKDVDGFHPVNAGLLATGQPCVVPCTPQGCLQLVHTVRKELMGLHVVVVGRSTIVGRPAAQVFLNADCSVTIIHKDSRDVPGHCRDADILVVAAGHAGLIQRDWVKPGAIVIDVGINRIEGPSGPRIVGDVAYDEVREVAAAITPVPGGVGPMTVATLMENTLFCAETRQRARSTLFLAGAAL
ncbi:MAG: tetrahydrofolate dehydrogenase/cyclohydrolase catalytic domain-containing protein [Candidatus Pacebacteria bacterium]|nr:tetrahydrofolate dehydrogenase/cyclohydrolase catalytic domain-containing protein [Candidatus Paceibacterota bacterium]